MNTRGGEIQRPGIDSAPRGENSGKNVKKKKKKNVGPIRDAQIIGIWGGKKKKGGAKNHVSECRHAKNNNKKGVGKVKLTVAGATRGGQGSRKKKRGVKEPQGEGAGDKGHVERWPSTE